MPPHPQAKLRVLKTAARNYVPPPPPEPEE